MTRVLHRKWTRLPRVVVRLNPTRVSWWLFFTLCAFYAAYALWSGAIEALSLAGLVDAAKSRAVPVLFVAHAVAGAVALVVGPLQFSSRLRDRRLRTHRLRGRLYVCAVRVASVTGVVSAVFFDVPPVARAAFAGAGLSWLATTTIAYRKIRDRRVAEHREWMVRSFSFALFFVTFELWVGVLEATTLQADVAYSAGVMLSWVVSLSVAEGWIRRSRPKAGRAAHDREKVDPWTLIASRGDVEPVGRFDLQRGEEGRGEGVVETRPDP